jgi:hypothetical protein
VASESQWLCPVNPELIEDNELFVNNRQHLQAVYEQLDLAMARLDWYIDQLETANQKRTHHGSTVHFLIGKLLSSRTTGSTIQSDSWSAKWTDREASGYTISGTAVWTVRLWADGRWVGQVMANYH